MARVSLYDRMATTIGALLNVLFVALPKDFWRWRYPERKDVRGKTIVITGAGSGLGRAMAEQLALQHGAKVAIIDINSEGAEETAKTISDQNGAVKWWTCDITDPDRLKTCADEIEKAFGPVDVVVCNAAILFFGRVLQLTTSQLQSAVNVNIMGTINTIRAFLRPMEIRNEGHIVAISSIAGHCGETNGLAYCPCKFAIRGIMEVVQMEMVDRGLDGIKFTTVCPFFARTPMILNAGMRPSSLFFPFMSAAKCAKGIVDAILQEKVTAYVPEELKYVTSLKEAIPPSTRMVAREFLNCKYEPDKTCELGRDEFISLAKSNDYFESVDSAWKMLTPALLLAVTMWWMRSETSWLLFAAFIAMFCVCRSLMAICSVILCDKLRFSFAFTFRWFIETLLFGLPSLVILSRYKNKTL